MIKNKGVDKMNTILKLWNGLLGHEELLSGKMKAKEKEDKEEEAYNAFWNSLSEEQQNLYREFEIYGNQSFYDQIDEAYVEGFQTGALLMIEVYRNE